MYCLRTVVVGLEPIVTAAGAGGYGGRVSLVLNNKKVTSVYAAGSQIGSKLGGHIFKRCISFQPDKSSQKPWREAASLLIVAPMNLSQNSSLGYLVIERSKMSSMPGGTVFPGGTVSPVDYSPRWIDLYKSAKIDLTSISFLSENAHIPDIYKTDPEGLLSKDVILRLTAIRETFEEVGVLICKPPEGRERKPGDVPYEYEEILDRKEVLLWQKKIRKEPDEFINLCQHLDCLPDISALSEWSNWLTPTVFKPKSRFDTMFYMIILPKMVRVVFDTHEAAGAQWAQPTSLLEEHIKGEVKLMPPQLYELSRLQNLKTLPELRERLQSRTELGIERYFPVIKAARDGQVFLLPGDELYPEEPDLLTLTKPNSHKLDSTLHELKSSCTKFHRSETKDGTYYTNINVTRYGQIY